jgi:hypothetical protein
MKLLAKILAVCALIFGGYAACAILYPTIDIRYRLTLDVDVYGVQHTDSGVVEIRFDTKAAALRDYVTGGAQGLVGGMHGNAITVGAVFASTAIAQEADKDRLASENSTPGLVAEQKDASSADPTKMRMDYCLGFREAARECLRATINSNWICVDRPKLNLKGNKCFSWAAEADVICRAQKGTGRYTLKTVQSYDSFINAPTGSLICVGSAFAPETETNPPLASVFAQAHRFFLPSEKFPQCLTVRVQAHECSRTSEANVWACDARPPIADATAQCLVCALEPPPAGTSWDNPLAETCRDIAASTVFRYITINVDPNTHRIEPKLRCDLGSAEATGSTLQILWPAPPRREPITAANVEPLEDYFREFANANYWMRRNSSGANLGDRITPNDLEDYNIGGDEVMSVAWNRFVMTTH